MFVEVHTPQHLTGQELDAYLARGWFRMGQTIFTTNFAHVKDNMLSTIWLRVKLVEYEVDSAHAKLASRNSSFTTHVSPVSITEEKEVLFTRYREALPFTISESLQHLMFGKDPVESAYNTYEVTVRADDKLIACGFFDLGSNSAEGIVSFYDPDYKKFSLGKYLIYSKIKFCKELGLEFFYPGYFVPGNPLFDYKLNIASAALQFLHLGTNSWRDISKFTSYDIPAAQMEARLNALGEMLETSGIENHVLRYEFFDAGLIPDMRNSELLDFPFFLLIGSRSKEPAGIVVVYDMRDDAYHLLVCMPVWKPDRTNPDTKFYSDYFIKPVQEIFATSDVVILAALIARLIQKVIPTVE